MKILAIEFSSLQRSAAATNGTRVGETIETGAGATFAFRLIESALLEARLEREQIECVAVGLGPGSYTGIRAGIAVAQGWQLGRSVKLVGISSAEAIAAQAHAEGVTGQIAVVIDAQRGEFYLAVYELGKTSWREIQPLRIASADVVRQTAAGGIPLFGPELERWFPGARTVFPRAAMLARLAAGRPDFVSGEKLEPIYLRETAFVKAPAPRALPAG